MLALVVVVALKGEEFEASIATPSYIGQVQRDGCVVAVTRREVGQSWLSTMW
jgi:hypothetical protein